MATDTTRIDGNATGLLAELFGPEMAIAQARCDGCGRIGPVGALVVYGGQMGEISRCPDCGTALIRVTLIRDTYRLDLRGLQSLHIPRGAIAARSIRGA